MDRVQVRRGSLNFYARNKHMRGGVILAKTQKDKQIYKEIEKLKTIFSELCGDDETSDKKIKLIYDLCEQAAFMKITLGELQRCINENGAVTTAINGNGFEVTAENPAQKSYNTMIKNYNSVLKTLIDLLPKTEKQVDEMLEFIKR